MSRYTGPSCKKCRRLNEKMFLKGSKCYNNCVVDRQKASRDNKFSGRRKKTSDYAKHLREKQIARFSAQICEAQFKRFYSMATKVKGQTGESFLKFLEIRLDNIVRRMGFAVSLKAARQMVNHGDVKVNGKEVSIPSYILKPGDTISVDSKIAERFIIKQGLEHADKGALRPSFLSFNPETLTGKVERWPDRSEVSIKVDEQLIVEYYSK